MMAFGTLGSPAQQLDCQAKYLKGGDGEKGEDGGESVMERKSRREHKIISVFT